MDHVRLPTGHGYRVYQSNTAMLEGHRETIVCHTPPLSWAGRPSSWRGSSRRLALGGRPPNARPVRHCHPLPQAGRLSRVGETEDGEAGSEVRAPDRPEPSER